MDVVSQRHGGDGCQNQRAVFRTPLSVQRYQYVEKFIIDHPDISSVTDLGCGNGRMLNWMKNLKQLVAINLVDIDEHMLDHQQSLYIEPNLADYLWLRSKLEPQLRIRAYAGNLVQPDDLLRADCITMVEVIEHMHLADVDKCMQTIFGYYQPNHVVITTPNSEFNHLLRDPSEPAGMFRHYDHKFEWTRAEFNAWAKKIQQSYSYTYYLDGVGHLENSEPYGPCTQIAVFRRVGEKKPVGSDLSLEEQFSTSLELDDSTKAPATRRSHFTRLCEYNIPAPPFKGFANDPDIEGFDW